MKMWFVGRYLAEKFDGIEAKFYGPKAEQYAREHAARLNAAAEGRP